jgi:hypothetical protein
MEKLVAPEDAPESVLQKVQRVLRYWQSPKRYPGPSWNGIEKIHLTLASVVDEVGVEAGGWYKYPSSTRSDKDGKDWRLVCAGDGKPVVINFHSLLHDGYWTLTTTIYETEEVDLSKVKMIGHPDAWARSMLWSIRLAKVLETDGYNYKPALEGMIKRINVVNELKEIAKHITPWLLGVATEVGVLDPMPQVTIAVNSWRSKGEGVYDPPTKDRPYGIITIDSELLSSFEAMERILTSKLILAVLNESKPNPSYYSILKLLNRQT